MLSVHQLQIIIAQKRVCEHLDFTIRTGERWAVLGLNGSGKTTLLHTLAGLRNPHKGDILLDGQPLRSWSGPMRARRVGLLLQQQSDPFPSTVLEEVLTGRHPHMGRWQREGDRDITQAKAALAAVGLADFEHRMITTLSGGERRRLAIATLLAQEPALLLLDEPTNHLDLYHQMAVLRLLQELALQQGGALLMTLHDINTVERYCDHVLLLYGEGLTLAGPTKDLLTEKHLSKLYHHPIYSVITPEGRTWVPALF